MTPLRVALAGNPNSGKTTLFNALTGSRQKVGNYAGVTVDTKEARLTHRGREIVLYDLPGTYSLTAYSLDEIIARDFVLEQKPHVIINVLDATNLERNLFLALQFREFGLPVVGALNIIDQAESMGLCIDHQRLSALLGLPLVRTVGPRGRGLELLLDAAAEAAGSPATPPLRYGPELETAVARLTDALGTDAAFVQAYPSRWMALKLLEKDQDAQRRLSSHTNGAQVAEELDRQIGAIERASGRDASIAVSEARYGTIHGAAQQTVARDRTATWTEYIDAVLINRVLGLPIFVGLLWMIFQATFTLGAYPQEWLEALFSGASSALRAAMPPGLLTSLLIGVLGGVGNVLSFLPTVAMLFFFISVLEDTGYMARAAFVMDKFLHLFGLHGQSFLPMMLGFGCSVPAMLASRSLKSPKDRIATVLVTPLMSCGAKLPVYVLLAGTFFPNHAGTAVLSVYLTGVLLALGSARLLRKTVLKGETKPFVMELPPYRLPTLSGMAWHAWDKSFQYFKKAGTVILAASVLVWAMTTFPQAPEGTSPERALETSAAGWLGRAIEPAVQPMGFDWKVGIATVTGFAAKETVVSTLGILYQIGEADAEQPLRSALKADSSFTPLSAYTLMLFTLLLAPCLAAQATMKAELGGRWLVFYLVASTALSWLICCGVYQVGSWLRLGLG